LNRNALITELISNQDLLNCGGREGNDGDDDGGGSDSDPSEDNMEEVEMIKIMPIKLKGNHGDKDGLKQ
jgi:hypothetical protein